MPNPLAYVVVFCFPLVAWMFFRRYPVHVALVMTVIWGYLFLPERPVVDPPLLPAFGKTLIPSLSAAVLAFFALRAKRRKDAAEARRASPRSGPQTAEVAQKIGIDDSPNAAAPEHEPFSPREARQARAARPGRRARPLAPTRGGRIATILITILFCAPVLIYLTNREPVIVGPVYLPPIRIFDIFSMMQNIGVMLLPLLLARHLLRGRDAQITVLRIMAFGGLVYSLFILFEVRFSPQINIRLYGFFAHSWLQHFRAGGYRPIVFLEHGLRVGIFMSMAILAAATLARSLKGPERGRWLLAVVWMLPCLYISKNLGATMITVVLLPVVLFVPRRAQVIFAALIAGLILLYPMARGSGLIPAERIVTAVAKISVDRAQSLEFRLRNEDILLARANLKPVTGWGLWGRQRVFDPETGRDMSITDGHWIIIIGVYGWIGYLALYGLICLPVIFSALKIKSLQLDVVDTGLMLILCANLIDLIPNSSGVPILWLIAGTVWARYEMGRAGAVVPETSSGRRSPRVRPPRPLRGQPAHS